MKNKNVNDVKYKEYRKQKILQYLILILSIIVIILEVLALFKKISMLWGIGIFAIMYILKKSIKRIDFKD